MQNSLPVAPVQRFDGFRRNELICQIKNTGFVDVALVSDAVESIFEYRPLWRAESFQFGLDMFEASVEVKQIDVNATPFDFAVTVGIRRGKHGTTTRYATKSH